MSRLVCIDAGHGGHDNGGASIADVVTEKELNLVYASELGAAVTARGGRVLQTRTTDTFVELRERCRIANKAKADVFVSLHFNASSNKKARGLQVLYCQNSVRGKTVANTIYNKVLVYGTRSPRDMGSWSGVFTDASHHVGYTQAAQEIVSHRASKHTPEQALRLAGIKQPFRTLAVLRGTNMPAALIEFGFLTNSVDLDQLLEPDTRKRLCALVADALTVVNL